MVCCQDQEEIGKKLTIKRVDTCVFHILWLKFSAFDFKFFLLVNRLMLRAQAFGSVIIYIRTSNS